MLRHPLSSYRIEWRRPRGVCDLGAEIEQIFERFRENAAIASLSRRLRSYFIQYLIQSTPWQLPRPTSGMLVPD